MRLVTGQFLPKMAQTLSVIEKTTNRNQINNTYDETPLITTTARALPIFLELR